jgi:phosphatidylglycerophosphatase A
MSSFLALVFIIFLKNIFPGQPLVISAIAVFFILFFYFAAYYFIEDVIKEGDYDQQWIVIDEFIGMLISGLPFLVTKNFNSWLLIFGFALFRFFDISKLSYIKKIDKINNPHGVLLDDVVAGLASAVILVIGIYIF